MLKRALVVLVAILMITSISCVKEKTNEEIYNEAQEIVMNMKSYTCIAEVVVAGNMKPQTYKMIQKFKAPDKCYIEVIEPSYIQGKKTIYNGKKSIVKQPKINQSWELNNFKNTLEANSFLGCFVYYILDTEEIVLNREEIGDKEYLRIDTNIPDDNYYFKNAKIWINIKDNTPFKLQILDGDNKIRLDIQYNEFEYNTNIDDAIYDI